MGIHPSMKNRTFKKVDWGDVFHFLFFDSRPGSCQLVCVIIISNKSSSSSEAALFCSFRASVKNHRHLGCRNIMRSRGCAVHIKGLGKGKIKARERKAMGAPLMFLERLKNLPSPFPRKCLPGRLHFSLFKQG